jgi:hypothetical protein
VTGAVHRVSRGLQRVTDDGVVDQVALDARAQQCGLGGDDAEVRCGVIPEYSAEGSEACPDGREKDDIGHA